MALAEDDNARPGRSLKVVLFELGKSVHHWTSPRLNVAGLLARLQLWHKGGLLHGVIAAHLSLGRVDVAAVVLRGLTAGLTRLLGHGVCGAYKDFMRHDEPVKREVWDAALQAIAEVRQAVVETLNAAAEAAEVAAAPASSSSCAADNKAAAPPRPLHLLHPHFVQYMVEELTDSSGSGLFAEFASLAKKDCQVKQSWVNEVPTAALETKAVLRLAKRLEQKAEAAADTAATAAAASGNDNDAADGVHPLRVLARALRRGTRPSCNYKQARGDALNVKELEAMSPEERCKPNTLFHRVEGIYYPDEDSDAEEEEEDSERDDDGGKLDWWVDPTTEGAAGTDAADAASAFATATAATAAGGGGAVAAATPMSDTLLEPAGRCPARLAKASCPCGKAVKSKCAKCGVVRYCGRACQAWYWNSHRPLCTTLTHLRAEGEAEAGQPRAVPDWYTETEYRVFCNSSVHRLLDCGLTF
jgi:hypothetical protein